MKDICYYWTQTPYEGRSRDAVGKSYASIISIGQVRKRIMTDTQPPGKGFFVRCVRD